MNVSELARQLRIHPQKLLQILPEFGFDIGARAVKIDDRVAQQIQREWRRIKFVLEKREQDEKEKEKEKEKELRRSTGVQVAIPKKLTVRELADRLQIPINKLIIELMKNGILANQNENIDHDTAVLVAEEMGFKVTEDSMHSEEAATNEHVEDLAKALTNDLTHPRPPVVVVMGHVDHGKTTLLDSIRSTNVVSGEAGGITQHIGAYQVEWTNPKTGEKTPLTFIDTPGHEAFTVMRSRGAKVADVAILVVAADDGVKPQTMEAINIIKAAKLPFVVAINKIDKPGSDVEKVRSELSQYNIISEEWGGDVPMIELSAKQKINLDRLLDNILLVADLHQDSIRANPDRTAAGTVIEAHVDKGEGPVVTILVQTGTLRINDPLVVNGELYGKVRALKNYRGDTMLEAKPSTPARILGFKITPRVGDILDIEKAGQASLVNLKAKRSEQTAAEHTSVTSSTEESDEEGKKVLNVIIKADTLGSLEAVVGSLERIKNEEAQVKVVGKGLGNIMADDASLAQTAGAIIFAFNVTVTPIAREMIQENGLRYEQYKVIYDLIDKVKDELEKMLNPELITTELGNFKLVAIFRSEKNTMIVGGRVESGKLVKDCKVRVKRKGEIIGAGKLTKLQTGKQEVKEVPGGTECGVEFSGKLKLEEGDILEAYKEEKKERKLVLS
jgi:translation initiation factor IF-2